MTPLAFVDTKTTGLDPVRHEIWEVAVIVRRDGVESEYVWQLPVDLGEADPISLGMNGFHERRWRRQGHKPDDTMFAAERVVEDYDLHRWANLFVELTRGCHLVGAVVSFDERRLWDLLRRHGQCPMWHHHLIDVEALAVGFLAGKGEPVGVPWKSDDLSVALGVKPPGDGERHTALGDTRWARDMYDTVVTRLGDENQRPTQGDT